MSNCMHILSDVLYQTLFTQMTDELFLFCLCLFVSRLYVYQRKKGGSSVHFLHS